MQKGFNGILTVPFFIFSLVLNAQVNSVSPYSKLGLGENYPETYARSLGFAGASIGVIDPLNINFSNPASYSALQLSTFEVGFEASIFEQKQLNPDINNRNGSAGLRYFSFGTSLTNWWGSAVGLQPYSFKGYDISSSRTLDDSINVTDRFVGSGGLNQIYWGNAFKVAKGLSIGVNAAFIFGKIEENAYVLFDDSKFVNTKIEEYASIKGFHFDYGLQYNYTFENGKDIGVGITYGNAMDLNADIGNYYYTFRGQVGSENPVDSLSISSNTSGKVRLPGEFGFGLGYGKMNEQIMQYSWMLSADFEWQKASEYVSYDGTSNIDDNYKIEFGAFVRPRFAFEKLNRNNAYWSAVEYRLGTFYKQTPYTIAGTRILDYGITFGLGFPVLQRNMAPGEVKVSTINTGIVLGRRGTTANGLIQENYLNIYIGVTLNDKWFVKYKYR